METGGKQKDLQPGRALRYRRGLGRRLACCWLLKAVGTTTMMSLFFVAYFHLLNHPGGDPYVMGATWVDQLVPFQPAFFYLYASLWFYVSLVPALIGDRGTLVRYGMAIGGLCLAGLAVFLVFPTSIERDPALWAGAPEFAWLAEVDSAGNAFPSLHVATALFSAFWMDRLILAMRLPVVWRLVSLGWALGIVYSTLAIAQHVFWDVLGGTMLAAMGMLATTAWVQRAGNAVPAGASSEPSIVKRG
ncbi:phosphatase PAP2 family protein [Guyparkeria sp.]|uniref:phosphatase PAP2 family protein n=1 Tax=Guyparkeria sp. TaxID=2035736 RepID=UPI003568B081